MVAKNSNAMNLNAAAGVVTWDGTSVMSATALTQYDVLTGGSTGNTINQVATSATSGVPLISQGSSTQPAFGTAVVAGGGTGIVTTTAYGVICGGTTATGNFQNAGAGSAGQILTSNGASQLPSFQQSPSFFNSVSLTSSQIKALNGTPITIVGAQGAGVTTQIISVGSYFSYGGTNAFTGGSSCTLAYKNASGVTIAAGVMTTTQLTSTANYVVIPLLTAVASTSTATDNEPVVVYATGSAFAGNAAANNTCTIYVTYIII